MQRTIREAIEIGYVEQALRLKKKILMWKKLIMVALGTLTVALAILLEVLDRQEALRAVKAQDRPSSSKDPQPQKSPRVRESVPQKEETDAAVS